MVQGRVALDQIGKGLLACPGRAAAASRQPPPSSRRRPGPI